MVKTMKLQQAAKPQIKVVAKPKQPRQQETKQEEKDDDAKLALLGLGTYGSGSDDSS